MKRVNRRNSRKNRTIIIAGLITITMCFTIAYSAFNTNINFNTKGNIKRMSINDLKKLVVTSGDGLYKDYVEPEKYFYRGENPNNYFIFSNEYYRIVNINEDNSLKIIKLDSIGTMAFDKENVRTQENGYCNNIAYGCSAWGSKYSTLDSNGSLVGKMPRENGGIEYELPSKDSSLNIYLNNTFYNSLGDEENYVVDYLYNVGLVNYQSTIFDQSLEDDIKQEEKYKWRGKVALMEISDYARTESDQERCGSVNKLVWENNMGNICKKSSWLYQTNNIDTGQISLNPISIKVYAWKSARIWNINDYGTTGGTFASDIANVRPILTLSRTIKFMGNGTKDNPYRIA